MLNIKGVSALTSEKIFKIWTKSSKTRGPESKEPQQSPKTIPIAAIKKRHETTFHGFWESFF